MKLRASWGQNGNDRIGNYGFVSVVNAGQNYTFGPNEVITNGNVALTPSNPDLQWETVSQSNIGIDADLLKGKLNFVADFYVKETKDMLYNPAIPLHVGAAIPPTQNIGTMQSNGVELSLTYRHREGDFKYSVGGNIAFVGTEVVSLGSNDDEFILAGRVQSSSAFVTRTQVGNPIGAFYGYVTDGIFQTVEEVAAHATQSENTAPGDIRFKDLNNDNIIDENDQTFIGNPTPDFTYGITGDASYRGFDVSLFLLGSQGNDIYNATTRYDFTYVNRPVSVLNRWTGAGTSTVEPKVSLSDPNQNARVSDRFVEDGSFLRIKNLQVGYSLPTTILEKMNIGKFRVYVSAQNLFTFTNYSGLDPEIGAVSALEIGIDRGFYPQARTFLGGINVEF